MVGHASEYRCAGTRSQISEVIEHHVAFERCALKAAALASAKGRSKDPNIYQNAGRLRDGEKIALVVESTPRFYQYRPTWMGKLKELECSRGVDVGNPSDHEDRNLQERSMGRAAQMVIGPKESRTLGCVRDLDCEFELRPHRIQQKDINCRQSQFDFYLTLRLLL